MNLLNTHREPKFENCLLYAANAGAIIQEDLDL